MDILYVCLYQKRLKEIVSACQPWHWKICWRGKWAIRRSCVYFSSTVMLIITLQWKSLMLIFTGNNAREFSHFFGRCTTPTLHRSKRRHPWLAEAPESSIWNNLLWIFHCSHSLERSFGTPNAYNHQKFRSLAHLLFDGCTFYPRFEILLLWIFFFALVGVAQPHSHTNMYFTDLNHQGTVFISDVGT